MDESLRMMTELSSVHLEAGKDLQQFPSSTKRMRVAVSLAPLKFSAVKGDVLKTGCSSPIGSLINDSATLGCNYTTEKQPFQRCAVQVKVQAICAFPVGVSIAETPQVK